MGETSVLIGTRCAEIRLGCIVAARSCILIYGDVSFVISSGDSQGMLYGV